MRDFDRFSILAKNEPLHSLPPAALRRQAGFTGVELILTLVIVIILLALGYPNYEIWSQNAKTKEAADSLLTGLRHARSEAVRRNSNVDFVLLTAMPGESRAASEGN